MSHQSTVDRAETRGKSLFAAAILIAALSALFYAGCSRWSSGRLNLPPDPRTEGSIGWVLVKSSYAGARTAPDGSSPILELVRGGTVFECVERRIDPKGARSGGLWYRYAVSGNVAWLHDADVLVFPTKARAEREAAQRME